MMAADAIKIPRTKAYSDHLAREFHQLRVDGELTNFTVHTSARSYRCHQAILAAVSPFFKAMISSGMTETAKQEVNLEHISGDVMEILLKYIYTGEVYIPQEKLLATLEASDFLQLLGLKELCLSGALKVFGPSNAISTYKLADTLNMHTLMAKCSNFILSSLAEISKYEEFIALTNTELSSFISAAQELSVDPDELLEATLDWIDGKPDQRITSLESMVQNIDPLQCTVQCLEREMRKREHLLIQCPKVHHLFTNGVVQIPKLAGSRKKYQVRLHGRILVIGGGGIFEDPLSTNGVCWELNEASFKEVCKIEQHSAFYALCATPTGFAVSGGWGCKLCSVFDITTKEWESLPPLMYVRFHHKAACIDKEIFVFGGWENKPADPQAGVFHQINLPLLRSASVHSLKIDGGEWTDEPDIPLTVVEPEVASVAGGIYLLDPYESKKLFYLDMEAKVWSTRAPIPCMCQGATMLSVCDQLLVAGGSGRERTFAHYNIHTDTWTTGSRPLLDHRLGAMFNDNMSLYLVGGFHNDYIEEYNMFTESWSHSDMRVPKRFRHFSALVLRR